jgi:hypothetical protein
MIFNMKEENQSLGKCPVCGKGEIVSSDYGWHCNSIAQRGKQCAFTLYRIMHGVEMTDELCRKLIKEGQTDVLTMKNKDGQSFRARFAIINGKVDVLHDIHNLDGKCPLCGGTMVKTCKGYICKNGIGTKPTCGFFIPGIICNRKITEAEVEMFLSGKLGILDGFATNDWKMFSSALIINHDGKVMLDSRIAKCPCCGGDIHVGLKAYNCSNYKNTEHPCNFSIWRHIGGHTITKEEAQQICEDGITHEVIEMCKEDGTAYYKRLALSPDKTKIIKI